MDRAKDLSFEQVSAALKCIGDGVIITDLGGKIVYINPTAEDITGWSAECAVGCLFSVVFPLVAAATDVPLESPVWQSLKTQATVGLPNQSMLMSRSGVKKYVSASCSPIKDTNGIMNGIVVVFRDITRLKNYEKQIQVEKNNLQMIVECNPMGMLLVDGQAVVKQVNRAFLDMFHFDQCNVVDQKFGDALCCIHSLECGCGNSKYCADCVIRKSISDVIKTGNAYNNKILRYELMSGANVKAPWFKINFVPVSISGETHVMIVIDDITSQKNYEDALKRSQQFYRDIFDNFPAMIWRTDLRGVGTYNNKRRIDFIGKSDADFSNDHWLDYVCPEDRDFGNEKYIGALKDGVTAEFEIRYKHFSGEYRWIHVVFKPHTNIDGNSDGFIGMAIDIHDRKIAELELSKAKSQAETANKAKSEFLANMSHEIRTPLNGVTGMIDLTLKTDMNPEQKENLLIAKNCASSLLVIINDILDFSKMEAGKLVIENVAFSLKKLVEETMKTHMVKANEKGLDLKYAFSAAVPDYILGDPNRIQQVINNLVSNAIKFTEHGGVLLEVTKANEEELRLSVTDTGIGVADLGKIFKSFSQLDASYTKKFGGTGLGLVISKDLVEMMGGRMWVESRQGIGSAFHFTLPYREAQQPADVQAPTPPVHEPVKTKTILLVEDDRVNQLIFARMLRERGHTVDLVGNGLEAVKAYQNKRYDLILMDIQMPEMDGIEATKLIRQMESKSENVEHTPIIALTAFALQGDRERFLSLGMDEYVSKPVKIDDLFRAINSVCRNNMDFSDRARISESGEIEFIKARREMTVDEIKPIVLEITNNIEALVNDTVSNKTSGIEGAAHRIKELFGKIDAEEMKGIAFRIELDARRGNLHRVAEHMIKLNSEFDTYKKSLKMTGEIK